MQRPNFQLIDDQPEKNYMRYVSQYKLDDMVNRQFFSRLFSFFLFFVIFQVKWN